MRVVVAAVVMAAGLSVLIAGCATERRPERISEFSAQRLGEPSPSAWLNPEERAALQRAGIDTHIDELGAESTGEGDEGYQSDEGDDAFPNPPSGRNKASQAMISLLAVGVTLGMAAAPFLLF